MGTEEKMWGRTREGKEYKVLVLYFPLEGFSPESNFYVSISAFSHTDGLWIQPR